MSKVSVILRGAPFGTRRPAEALRMSVGQTLADNEVRLIFAGDSVYILGDVNPSLIGGGAVQRPLETLRMLGHAIYAEAESLDERGVTPAVPGVERIPRARIAELLAESDVTIAW